MSIAMKGMRGRSLEPESRRGLSKVGAGMAKKANFQPRMHAGERRFLQVPIGPDRFGRLVGRMPPALSAFICVHPRLKNPCFPRTAKRLP
jgi:hypothetical protein